LESSFLIAARDKGQMTKDGNTPQDQQSAEDIAEEVADAVDAFTAELEQLRAERDEMKDRFMRVLADAENSRKRAERDRREAEQYGGSRLARDMLPVYDNLRRALDAATDDQRTQAAALIEGVELTMRELTNVLTRHGVKPITPAPGDSFDPQLHEAMFEAPLPGTRAGQIIQVMTEGFLLHDRLLRPAQVGVSSNSQG
jgi:molecular chaperone GrpE